MSRGFHPRMPEILTPAAVVLGVSIMAASGLSTEVGAAPSSTVVQAWKSVSGAQLLCIEGDHILVSGNEPTRGLGIARCEPHAWTIRDNGQLRVWNVSQEAESLRTEVGGRITEYRRLDSVPESCVLKALPVGPALEIPRERVLEIARDMHERLLRDQAAIKSANGSAGPESKVIVENREYLKALIQELGWIDVHRFGNEASGNAIVLAKHSQDLALMMGILPFVEKDYRNRGADDVVFAILYDAVQIKLGRKQRYGTQLGLDSEGHPMVLPLEDASKVEQFRKEIGLPPLAEYLQLASEGLYSGNPIRMPGADE
jgi:hypothetical protein